MYSKTTPQLLVCMLENYSTLWKPLTFDLGSSSRELIFESAWIVLQCNETAYNRVLQTGGTIVQGFGNPLKRCD